MCIRDRTRYAVADKAGPYNVEIDLGGSYPLNSLQILEWKGSDEKGKTRSSQTSIAVYDGTDWKTVVDKQSLSREDNLTAFDLGGAVGSKVRITFNNVGGNNKSATIYEISCSSALPEPIVKTDQMCIRDSLCSVTKDPCCKCLPDPFPIQSISSLMIIIALVFFYNLSADTLCQSPADAKTCRLNKLGYIASALVLAAAVIRFYSLNTSRKTRLEQTEFGEIWL